VQTLSVERRQGPRTYTDTYRFASQLPLRDGDDALEVNWCELTTTRDDGKVVYHNAFATHHPITAANVAEIVRAGRARWKVENENNNTLKTKGYHLTHNFGHGKQHLSALLATLNLLAFLFHTLPELLDSSYQRIRQSSFSGGAWPGTRGLRSPRWRRMRSITGGSSITGRRMESAGAIPSGR